MLRFFLLLSHRGKMSRLWGAKFTVSGYGKRWIQTLKKFDFFLYRYVFIILVNSLPYHNFMLTMRHIHNSVLAIFISIIFQFTFCPIWIKYDNFCISNWSAILISYYPKGREDEDYTILRLKPKTVEIWYKGKFKFQLE